MLFDYQRISGQYNKPDFTKAHFVAQEFLS